MLTDSDGVQQEALTLKIPTVTLRYNIERPETVLYKVNVLTGTDPESIRKLTEEQAQKFEEIRNGLKMKQNPFGDALFIASTIFVPFMPSRGSTGSTDSALFIT